ncbi:MAG: 3' terminal RNA ribose 2'-O-methyltransferase Hen1 [Candidatus Sumerlaeia bacterium]|nr:3' terminal RNA ribose 2'-O-methyltransferase Hen1 [Candidatus Sumerlaeia bacterium]
MLLEISTTHRPATDLGYLLHKNPARVARKSTTFGDAVVFYTEASEDLCTAVLLVDIDPVGLVRGRGAGGDGAFDAYVNDRPYVGSSFLSSAIADLFGTALNGRSRERPELAETAIPLRARIPAVRCQGGHGTFELLFGPLGYAVDAVPIPLDEAFPSWGASKLYELTLTGQVRLCDLLRHLYILLPVLDAAQHYWIGESEIEKLVEKGRDWLSGHPAKEFIASRYLRRRQSLVNRALESLATEEGLLPEDEATESATSSSEERRSLNDLRLESARAALLERQPARVIDLGCGEGKLLARLIREPSLREVAGVDVSLNALEAASRRLNLATAPSHVREKMRLFQSSLLYVDSRLRGYDAAALIEVIEHIDPLRLPTLERVLFEQVRPGRLVVTTPNVEYNVQWESLAAGTMRHEDHRFEWTRAEFQEWAAAQARRFGYTVEFRDVGPVHPETGPPTQMAVFDRVAVGEVGQE